ncbi:prepilin-type N-terminal cleavage/methylation domain-containing protein [Akkermansiaceae bacterium]|nr:prepilin-type N-terminal cleavage/methylation domain-containing protein [Akkermansiaceae bacterium]
MLRTAYRTRTSSKGFSLVELLAVMTIIAILLSLASVGISKIGKGQGITSGISLAEGLVGSARSLAKGQGTTTRLIIHTELNDTDPVARDRYRRLMMVVYHEIDPDTGVEKTTWSRSGSPIFLPDQVFFSGERSRTEAATGGNLPKDTFQLSNDPSDTAECFYYEFNSQGICTTPGASFVLENGARPNGQDRAILGKGRNIGGFVIWRNGSTSMIRDIDQIDSEN